MDKEIIIDGVDVSECEFLWKEKLPKKVCNNGNLDCNCKANSDCRFKQLARAKNKIDYMEIYIKTVENARNELELELKRKNQEYEELRRHHNKCCEENTEKLKQWLEKYNQLSIDFYNGKYCNKENCGLLKAKEQEREELNSDNHYFVNKIISLELLADKYELTFEEVEKNIKEYCKNMCMAETKETCDGCQNTKILNIINEVKEE